MAAPARHQAPRLPKPLPLDGLYTRRIEQLEQLVGEGRFHGWGRDRDGLWFVDVGEPADPDRFLGATLHLALGTALRALGRPDEAEEAARE